MKLSQKLYIGLFLLLSFGYQTQGDANPLPGWGKVVCESVTSSQANSFAQSHQVKGTVSCMLPLKAWEIPNNMGDPKLKSYSLYVVLVDPPMLPDCKVTYFDGVTPSRAFKASGSGHGYINLVPGIDTFDLAFSIFGPSMKTDPDNLIAIEINTHPTLMLISEMTGSITDEETYVSQCHMELP